MKYILINTKEMMTKYKQYFVHYVMKIKIYTDIYSIIISNKKYLLLREIVFIIDLFILYTII